MRETGSPIGVYGRPPAALADIAPDAVQLSPTVPGAAAIEDAADGSFEALTVLAPPGTEERRFTLAHALRTLAPGGRLLALAPKDRGGARLARELAAFGCEVAETARRHHRLCAATRPAEPVGLDAAVAAGAPRVVAGLWTQPGVFSWRQMDPGSAFLAARLPALAGRVADLGCGTGALARAALSSPRVTAIHLVDLDRRAVACARRNVDDVRATFAWADALLPDPALADLDVVVCNPPFHAGGGEDRSLGQAFLRRAHVALRRGGTLHVVANRHLPYEATLRELFATVTPGPEAHGYKLFEARK